MNIIVAGGTGFIGKALIDKLIVEHHSVTLLTRTPSKVSSAHSKLRVEQWDARTIAGWGALVSEADVIVNLTGESIGGKRWTARQKEVILGSRVESTRVLVKSIAQDTKKSLLLINASGVGYYGDVPEGDVTESSPNGKGFLADVCNRWEEEALTATKFGARVVTTRNGVVLGRGGQALPRMVMPFKFFIGGHLGNGRQWFPWIHLDDVIGGMLFIMRTPALSGAVNFVAPETVTMREFSKKLGEILRRPSWAPVPSPVLRMLLGEMAEMILTGQCVIPKKLLDSGYSFRYPTLSEAFQSIFHEQQHL